MPKVLFFSKTVLAFWDPLWFHTDFRIAFFYFYEEHHEILVELTLNLSITLGSMEILPIVVLLIHEYGACSYCCDNMGGPGGHYAK